jgi:hypothetical protein
MKVPPQWVVAVLGALLVETVHAAPPPTDPFTGTWMLTASQSHYESERPEIMTIVMTPAGNGLHYRSRSRLAGGRLTFCEYTASYDGELAVVTSGSGLMAPVSLKRVDANTVQASYVRGLKEVASSQLVTSANGKTLTITTISRGPDGQTRTNVAVFEREVNLR